LPKFLKLQENGLEHAVDALRKNYFDRWNYSSCQWALHIYDRRYDS
jgi:hypothetical protein